MLRIYYYSTCDFNRFVVGLSRARGGRLRITRPHRATKRKRGCWERIEEADGRESATFINVESGASLCTHLARSKRSLNLVGQAGELR